MKKIILFLAIFAFTVGVFAQNKGTVTSLTVDTIPSATAVNFPLETQFKNNDQIIVIQAVCAEISGTSEGNLYLEGSLDGISYETITSTAGFMYAFPNDTLTIADGAVGMWYLENTPFNYYRLQGTGGASDSTEITVKWVYKDK